MDDAFVTLSPLAGEGQGRGWILFAYSCFHVVHIGSINRNCLFMQQ